jgi:hypothetical protein
MTTAIKWLDRPPAGWFPLDVMKAGNNRRKQDWVALMIDVHPDELKHRHMVREAWVRIPGKHRSRDAAWDAFQDMIETRH